MQNQLPDVFESYGRLADLAAVLRGDGVEQMRSGHAARRIQIPAAAFDQVIVKQAKDVIRRNPAALRVDNAEAVGIAVSGEAGLRFARLHLVSELAGFVARRVQVRQVSLPQDWRNRRGGEPLLARLADETNRPVALNRSPSRRSQDA